MHAALDPIHNHYGPKRGSRRNFLPAQETKAELVFMASLMKIKVN